MDAYCIHGICLILALARYTYNLKSLNSGQQLSHEFKKSGRMHYSFLYKSSQKMISLIGTP
jgi:hypothetical protein